MSYWDVDEALDAENARAVERLRADPEPKAYDTYRKLAHPSLVGLGARYLRIESLTVEVPLVLREPTDHVSPESWNIYPTGVYEDTIWDAELQGWLKQQTPQALLRDLHRPEYRDEPFYLEPVEGQKDESPFVHAPRTIEAMKREPLPELVSSTVLLREAGLLRREFYDLPWKGVKDDSEPRTVYATYGGFSEEE